MPPEANDKALFDPKELAREFNYLAKLIFGVEPGPELAESYIKANTIIFCGASVDQIQKFMIAALERKYDLEAIEVALRLKTKSNFLTQKIQILFYLMETRPEYFSLFVNKKGSMPVAYILLSIQTLRSLFMLIKGVLLLRSPLCRDVFCSKAGR